MAKQIKTLTRAWADARFAQEMAAAHKAVHARHAKRIEALEAGEGGAGLMQMDARMITTASYVDALEMYESGLTLSQIAAKIGVSKGRAGHMVQLGRKAREELSTNPEVAKLSIRARNAIRYEIGVDPISLPAAEVARRISVLDMTNIPNVGSMSLNELAEFIDRNLPKN